MSESGHGRNGWSSQERKRKQFTTISQVSLGVMTTLSSQNSAAMETCGAAVHGVRWWCYHRVAAGRSSRELWSMALQWPNLVNLSRYRSPALTPLETTSPMVLGHHECTGHLP